MEHLVIVLEGEMEFVLMEQQNRLNEGEGLFLQAGIKHTTKVMRSLVKSLQIYTKTKDKYYEKVDAC